MDCRAWKEASVLCGLLFEVWGTGMDTSTSFAVDMEKHCDRANVQLLPPEPSSACPWVSQSAPS